MKRVRHSVVAFGTTAAAIMSVIAADPCARPARAQAEDWPTRPLTLVVPFSAGGSSDTIGRIIADGIGSNLRRPVVVENVAGAGGMVGGSRVAKAIPDGYQFVIGNVGTFAQSQWLYKAPLYNAVTDFAPVALLTDESLVLVARNDFPAPTTCSSLSPTRRQTRRSCTTAHLEPAAPITLHACCSIPRSVSRLRTFRIATSCKACRK